MIVIRGRGGTALGALVLLGVLAACARRGPPAPQVERSYELPRRKPTPQLILGRTDRLVEAERRSRMNGSSVRPALDLLIAQAESAMLVQAPSVMQKQRIPPSGDKHDFMSLAPYWWPDSTRPNGLPYVRRDGEVNPESRTDHDGLRFQRMADAVEVLALASYLSDDAKYALRAATLLRVWFVDPATRMNPHLRFAQAVPGVNDGRGIGIIDTRHFPQLVDAMRLLESSWQWPSAERDAVEAWCRDYLTWLRTSENGRDEGDEENNHGTWYDAQVAALALYVGDSAVARDVLDRSARQRVASQIEPDGRQPRELARTRPLHYSVFNLEAFTALAEMARHVNVDLWRHTAPGGGSILAALRFVAPYADPGTPWPTPQVTPAAPLDFVLPLRRAADATGDRVFSAAVGHLPPALTRTHRSRFLHPNAP